MIKKNIIRLIVAILVSLILSIINIQPGEFLMGAIFNVTGIVFSVGLGLIVTFNMSGIKNKGFLSNIRGSVNSVRDSFIFYFLVSVFAYITSNYLGKSDLVVTSVELFNFEIDFHLNFALCIIMLFSLAYFIINFFSIQKLNNQIHDQLIEE